MALTATCGRESHEDRLRRLIPFVLKPLVGRADDPAQPEPVDYDLGLNIDDLPRAVATIG